MTNFLALLFLTFVVPQVCFADPACTNIKSHPLRSLVKRNGFLIGTAVNDGGFKSTKETEFRRILAEQFNSLTPEYVMKFKPLQPKRGHFDFSRMDALAKFAQDHHATLHAHCLVWHQSLPDWVVKGKFTREQKQTILKTHITTVMKHLRKKHPKLPIIWDVVNEAVDADEKSGMRKTVWSTAGKTPEESIELAFRWAHKADPKAKLYYNDFGAEGLGKKSDLVFNLVSRLKRKGVPIDGVGLQSHFQEGDNEPQVKEIAANIRRYSKIGLKVQITEMDYGLKTQETLTTDQLERQANVYESLLKTCLGASNCAGFTTWGFTDRYSWIPDFTKGSYGAALPFDSQYRPKPAFCKMSKVTH